MCRSLIESIIEIIDTAMEDSMNNIESLARSQIYNLEIFAREMEIKEKNKDEARQLDLSNVIRNRKPVISLNAFQYKVSELMDRLLHINYVERVKSTGSSSENTDINNYVIEEYNENKGLNDVAESSYAELALVPILQKETKSCSSYYDIFSFKDNIYENHYLCSSIVDYSYNYRNGSNFKSFAGFVDCNSVEEMEENSILETFLTVSPPEEISENPGVTTNNDESEFTEKNNSLTKINEVYIKILNSPDYCYTSSYVTVKSIE
ncbi:hypothetical protein FG386_002122 [Cryptosporidium ryanae]|uniref:uncharacterized protein n=1 Tax=Cryptosporidium ryanae TaxID=515981 RepID=UPI00351A919E|nr:hypothetical protein FG386_002122 [Cryptosporidium ryanae]